MVDAAGSAEKREGVKETFKGVIFSKTLWALIIIIFFTFIFSFIVGYFRIIQIEIPKLGIKVELSHEKLNLYIFLSITLVLLAIVYALSNFLKPGTGKKIKRFIPIGVFFVVLVFFFTLLPREVTAREVLAEKIITCNSTTYSEELKGASPLRVGLVYILCLVTGHYPTREDDVMTLSSFLFAFFFPSIMIYQIVYGIFVPASYSSIGTSSPLQKIIGKRGAKVFSIFITLYITRTLFSLFFVRFVVFGTIGLISVLVAYFISNHFALLIEEEEKEREAFERVMEVMNTKRNLYETTMTALNPHITLLEKIKEELEKNKSIETNTYISILNVIRSKLKDIMEVLAHVSLRSGLIMENTLKSIELYKTSFDSLINTEINNAKNGQQIKPMDVVSYIENFIQKLKTEVVKA